MQTDTRSIAELGSMPRLLAELGFGPNELTRRCACALHGGSNRSAFSWTEAGLWKCHSCGAGGDRVALVRAARHCSFRDAVEFLATLAGVDYRPALLSRDEIESQIRKREHEAAEANALLAKEFAAWIKARDTVLRFEELRRNAGKRLDAIHYGEQERWPGEEEVAWDVLAGVSWQIPRASAAYYVISFASAKDRFVFAIEPQERERLTDEALERGWVADEKGYRFEVQL